MGVTTIPRDSSGLYSLPSGYFATTGQTIQSSQHNPPLEDVAAALTGSLPRNGSAGMLTDLPMGGNKVTGLGAGSDPGDAATVTQVGAAAPPIGSVINYAGSSPPSGWLLCQGQSISRATYAALFVIIGTTYGPGNGLTTFELPDCRGRVSAGKDNMGGPSADRLTGQVGGVNGDVLGATGGVETHTLTATQLAAHTHAGTTAASGAHSHDLTLPSRAGDNAGVDRPAAWGNDNIIQANETATTSAAPTHTHAFTTDNAGGGQAHNNVQPVIIFNVIIRTGV